MSYKRKFSQSLPISVSISDPLVEGSDGKIIRNSGKVTVTVGNSIKSYTIGSHGTRGGGNFSEKVDVSIHVDTDLYDLETNDCKGRVGLLTSSVVATEAAQVKNIYDNSHKVARTIVEGFFKNVSTNISTRVLELRKKVESTLILLKSQADELLKRKALMENDYRRTTARYVKIMTDLNNELERRVKALDQPVFTSREMMSDAVGRMFKGGSVFTSSVINSETNDLCARLGNATLKSSASNMNNISLQFINKCEETKQKMSCLLLSEIEINKTYHIPVLCLETSESKKNINRSVFYDREEFKDKIKENVLLEKCFSQNADKFNEDIKLDERTKSSFINNVNNAYTKGTEHEERVRKMLIDFIK